MKEDVLYARVSSQRQDTLSQWPQLRAWAACQGVLDPEEVQDTGTGKTMSRKGIQSVLAGIRSGEVKRIVVVSINRLGRNARQVLEVVEMAAARGVSIVSIREQIDTNTAMGRCMIGLLASLAQLENEQRSEATLAGLDVRFPVDPKTGRRIGWHGSNKGYSLKVTPDIAETIRLRHKQGWSYRRIAKLVHLSDKTVREVILNPRPFYANRRQHAEYKKITGK